MKEDLLYKLDRGWLGGSSTDPNSLSHSHFSLSRRAWASESEPYRRSTLIVNFGGVTGGEAWRRTQSINKENGTSHFLLRKIAPYLPSGLPFDKSHNNRFMDNSQQVATYEQATYSMSKPMA